MENIQNEDENKIVDATEDEVKSQIIEKYELNEEDNADLIENLVKDKLEGNKKLSTAITQKIKQREKVEELESKIAPKPEQPKEQPQEEEKVDIDAKVNEVLEKRELDELEYSDAIKESIKTFATVQGVGVKKAKDSPFIKFLIDEEEKQADLDGASLGTGHKASTKEDLSTMKPTDFNLMTKEGLEKHAKYLETIKKKMGS